MKRFLLLALLLYPVKPTAAAIRLPPHELFCLARAVYHESRGEPELGQVAVAHVILNRFKSPDFPKTICGVVYQPGQFTDIMKYHVDFNSSEWTTAFEIATIAYSGMDESPVGEALYYYNPAKVKEPLWAKTKKHLVRIHNHLFLGDKNV